MQGNQVAKNVQGTNLVSRTVDGETGYYMYNGHGDVTVVQAAYGDPLATYYYDAFGNILEQTGSINNSTTFAGYTYDKETGLYYLNARMYYLITARFLQEDTYRGQANDPLSLNLYGYCHNEPVMYTDPDGHMWKWLEDTGNAVYGFGGGVVDAGVSTAQGLYDVGKTGAGYAKKTVTDPKGTYNRLKDDVTFVIENHETVAKVAHEEFNKTLDTLGDVIVKANNDFNNGDARTKGKVFGRIWGEIGTAVVSAKGIDKLSKLGKATEISKTIKLNNTLRNAEKLLQETCKAETKATEGITSIANRVSNIGDDFVKTGRAVSMIL